MISYLSCRIPKSSLIKINELLVKLFKLDRNSESRQKLSTAQLQKTFQKAGNSSTHLFTTIAKNTIKISSSISTASLPKNGNSYSIYKTSKSDFTTLELISFTLKKQQKTQLYKRFTLTNHKYGTPEELSELKETINYCYQNGIENIIISGVFCYNGKNPTTVIDRSYIKFTNFRDVLTQAKLQGIKVIIEFETKVGTRFPSKKYRSKFLKVNHHGEVTHLKFGMTLSHKFDDMYCINYADFENWKLTAGEIKYVMNKFGSLISGICIKDIGLMPLIFQRDFSVLSRRELDNSFTYGENIKKFGYVVNFDPYYYGSNFKKESQNAFLKYLSTEIRNATISPDFQFFDDSSAVDETGDHEFIKNLNANGIHPLIRGMSLTTNDHSLSNFQKNFELQKNWIKEGLVFTFVYDSTQPLTKSTYANLMTILLGHNRCFYESHLIDDLCIVRGNAETDLVTNLRMLRRIPRADPVSEVEYVDKSRYLYIYNILNNILRESGKDQLKHLFAFVGKNLCERTIGFFSQKNAQLILANTTGGTRDVLVNLNEVLRILLKRSNIDTSKPGNLFLNVRNVKSGLDDLYDFAEVLDNGLILEFYVRIEKFFSLKIFF